MIRRCQPLLGTFVELTLGGARESALHREADKAFQLIRYIQRMMSVHATDSDIARLNQCGHIVPLRVHPWTWHVIQHALRLSAETEGAFDITRGTSGGWRHIELLADSCLRFHQPLQLDLGGIAKGFAVDKATDYLTTRGISTATVNAGGDLRIHGQPDQTIAIRHPAAPQAIYHRSPMHRPAAATSAAYFSQGKNIIHPDTGSPMSGDLSVTIFAATCMEADALTKAVILTPPRVWTALLKARDSLALILTAGGTPALHPA
jgi:thiamine biosynthesis lipoprotein